MVTWRKIVARPLAFAALVGSSASATSLHADTPAPTVDFTRDVRPILAANCFKCHGPDPVNRKSNLRLDVWQDAGDIQGAESVTAAEKPADSELVARIMSDDPDERMPPADSGKTLTPRRSKRSATGSPKAPCTKSIGRSSRPSGRPYPR
jgi:hypothetical protein